MITLDLRKEFRKAQAGEHSTVVLRDTSMGITNVTTGQPEYLNSQICTESQHLNSIKLELGKYTTVAQGCKFMLSGNHNYKRATVSLLFDLDNPNNITTNGNIKVGNDVWIGYGCTVMSGVTIGDGAVVAAGSIVTKDVEPYTIVGGSPAKFIKRRFTEDISERLLASKWWDLPHDTLYQYKDLITSEDIEAFLDAIEKIK